MLAVKHLGGNYTEGYSIKWNFIILKIHFPLPGKGICAVETKETFHYIYVNYNLHCILVCYLHYFQPNLCHSFSSYYFRDSKNDISFMHGWMDGWMENFIKSVNNLAREDPLLISGHKKGKKRCYLH